MVTYTPAALDDMMPQHRTMTQPYQNTASMHCTRQLAKGQDAAQRLLEQNSVLPPLRQCSCVGTQEEMKQS